MKLTILSTAFRLLRYSHRRLARQSITMIVICLQLTLGYAQSLTNVNCTASGLPGQRLGSAVARVGDVDGDGVEDYVMSASLASLVKMISGATGETIYQIQGTPGDQFGAQMSVVGDLNNDGTNDWIVSAVGGPNTYACVVSSHGTNIFRADNPWHADSSYGFSVAGVGDMNGDDVPDFAIGAPGRGPGAWPGGFEIRSGANNDVLVQLVGDPGLAGSNLGISIAGVGDINHDGTNDVAVGAQFYDGLRGFARVYSGHHLLTTNFNSAVMWHWEGSASGDFFGLILGSADFDRDGTNDVVVGASQNSGGAGYVKVFSGFTSLPLATLRRPQCEQSALDYFGLKAAIGYFDGDSHPDLVISAPTQTGIGGVYGFSGLGFVPIFSKRGAAGERFGTELTVLGTNHNSQSKLVVSAEYAEGGLGHACVFDVENPGCSNPTVIQSISGVNANAYENGIGISDVDGDGFDDVLTTSSINQAKVYSGRSGSTIRTHTGSPGQGFANSVASLGDIDGDGAGDYIVGAYLGNSAYVYSGGSGALLATHTFGESPDAWYGYAVSAAGDVNGDGVPDYMVSAPWIGSNPWFGVFDVWSGATRTLIRRVRAETDPELFNCGVGMRLAAVGDLNGDGFDDVAVGALFYNYYQGKVFVCSGANLTDRNAIPGDTAGIQFVTLWSKLGLSNNDAWGAVERGADFNGDGVMDLLVGGFQPFDGYGYLQILSGVDGAVLHTLNRPVCSTDAIDYFGYQSTAADVNGDGQEDIIVSAAALDSNGALFVFSGTDYSLLYEIPGGNGERVGTELSIGRVDQNGRLGLFVAGNEGRASLGDKVGVLHVLTFGCPNSTVPTIAWPTPADIAFGTPLSATQLNAVATDLSTGASIPGTYLFTPAEGTVLPVGNGQPLSVLFTPADQVHYTTATAQVNINVSPAPTTVTLTSSANPSQLGAAVTLTATVLPTSASGTVTFFDGSNPIGTATISSGQASVVASGLSLGSHAIQASYAGDASHLGGAGSLNQVVKQTITVTARLLDSAGAPISGARMQYYSGSWQTLGYTDSSGSVSVELSPGSYNFAADHAFTRATKAQNISTDSTVVFQTTRVVARLIDSSGAPLAGAKAQYYAGAWRDIGFTGADGNVAVELLAGNYNFGMDYAFTRNTKTQNVGVDATVIFQTIPVITRLLDSAGSPLMGAKAQYYAGAWRDIGFTGADGNAAVELLAGNYNFGMDYAFTRNTKTQDVGLDATVVFQTIPVIARLLDSAGSPLMGAKAQYYAGAWRDIGFTGADGNAAVELLAGNYNFGMDYAFTRNTKTQNVGLDATVVFQTIPVVARLIDSSGIPLAGAKAQYYAGAWRDIGFTGSNGNVAIELLAGTYNFSVDYAFGRTTKNQNAGTDTTVVFQTGRVHSTTDTCTQYYGGAWRTFVNDMELLPLTWNFKFSDGTPNTNFAITAGVTTTIH